MRSKKQTQKNIWVLGTEKEEKKWIRSLLNSRYQKNAYFRTVERKAYNLEKGNRYYFCLPSFHPIIAWFREHHAASIFIQLFFEKQLWHRFFVQLTGRRIFEDIYESFLIHLCPLSVQISIDIFDKPVSVKTSARKSCLKALSAVWRKRNYKEKKRESCPIQAVSGTDLADFMII